MALININQNHLVFAFGLLGNIISFLVYLAPLPTFYRIYKNKSTGEFQSLPYLVALFSSMLWLYYGLLKPDAAALITINSFGCFVELIYIIMYISYAAKGARNSTIRLFAGMNVVCFAIILLVTQFALHNAVLRVQVLGWICVSISVSVFAAPLSIVAQVIRTKSVRFMPFNLSFSLTLSAIIWFFYGLFLKDICIALPNVAGFILGILQMLLYAVYRNGDAKKKVVKKENEQESDTDVIKENENENENEKEETTVINIVVVNTLGSCEVYPIPVDANGDVLSNEQLQGTKDAKETEKSVEAN